MPKMGDYTYTVAQREMWTICNFLLGNVFKYSNLEHFSYFSGILFFIPLCLPFIEPLTCLINQYYYICNLIPEGSCRIFALFLNYLMAYLLLRFIIKLMFLVLGYTIRQVVTFYVPFQCTAYDKNSPLIRFMQFAN